MRIDIRHHLSLTLPPGTGHMVAQLLLTPQSGPSQRIESWSVEMPGIGNAGRFKDAYGNAVHLVNQSRPEGPLLVTVRGQVETTDRNGVLGRMAGEPVPTLFKRVTPLTRSPATLHGKFRNSRDSRLDVLHALMARVGEVLAGDAGQEQVQTDGGQSQSQGQVAKAPAGASEHAHAFIAAARALDIPARYVTGYLVDGPDGASAFHAWAEAFDDRLGWIGFDPLLQLCPTERYVRLAAGLDAAGAQPIRAVPMGDGVETLEASAVAAA